MVDIQQAIDNSMKFASASLGPERTFGIRLEEVESSQVEGKAVWLITLSSAKIPDGLSGSIRIASAFLGADVAREYKVFMVAKDSGEVLSMKIRLLTANPVG